MQAKALKKKCRQTHHRNRHNLSRPLVDGNGTAQQPKPASRSADRGESKIVLTPHTGRVCWHTPRAVTQPRRHKSTQGTRTDPRASWHKACDALNGGVAKVKVKVEWW
eukprot:6462167-Amphidinium_carterae.2